MRHPLSWSAVLTASATVLGSCGTYVPQQQEFWEGVDISGNADLEYRIKENIFCETVHALRDVRQKITVNGQPSIPDDYGVQMQISLTVEAASAVNAGVALTSTWPSALVNKVTVGRTESTALSGTLSSTATRTDTSYSYYNVAKISAPGNNKFCDDPLDLHGSSPLLKSDLGIEDYLRVAVTGADTFRSSAPAKGGAGKTAKLDVYSYEIKFVVVSNGGVNPQWKLVNITANNGTLPLVTAGRTRTHDLTLTFGPGTNNPTDFALQTHFTNQIVQSNMHQRQGGGL
jgi:hypothetical protein